MKLMSTLSFLGSPTVDVYQANVERRRPGDTFCLKGKHRGCPDLTTSGLHALGHC